MEVRQARAADWESLRELRLRALADAPDAFASTLETERSFPSRSGGSEPRAEQRR
jgi:hypothetical protein